MSLTQGYFPIETGGYNPAVSGNHLVMLGLERKSGESIIVRTPDGSVRLTVVGSNPETKVTTFDLHFSGSSRPPLTGASRALGEPLRVDMPRGSVTFHVFRVRGRSVFIGVDPPRDWHIERPDMKGRRPA